MWQRIQTLWLLLAGVTMTLLLLVPLAMSSQGVKFTAIGFTSPNLETNYITWGLFALDALVAFLCFFTIFLFKKKEVADETQYLYCLTRYRVYHLLCSPTFGLRQGYFTDASRG